MNFDLCVVLCVSGLGDSNYTNFCRCGREMDRRLLDLGAKQLYPSGWADDATGYFLLYFTSWQKQIFEV